MAKHRPVNNAQMHAYCQKHLGYCWRSGVSLYESTNEALGKDGQPNPGVGYKKWVLLNAAHIKRSVAGLTTNKIKQAQGLPVSTKAKPLGKSLPGVVYKPSPAKKSVDVVSDALLSSYESRVVRMQALKKYGAQCQCCGVSPPRAVMNVDHVKPRRLFPALALDVDNLQVLCDACNHGKGNWDQTDWRPEDDDPETIALLRRIAHGN